MSEAGETGPRSTQGQPTPRELEAIAIEAASEGARVVRAASGELGTVRTKSTPTDPVTSLDIAAERAIRAVLARRSPGASVLGEEDGEAAGSSGIGWIVDPIDGTVNLTYDLPVMGVSVAATRKGEIVAGSVADVVREEVFSAALGGGARLDGQPLGVSAATDLANSLIGTGFAYTPEGRALEAAFLARVLPMARDIRCFGSAALNMCWVGCGRLDGFYQRNMQLWDYAAGELIASEGGATLTRPTSDNGRLMVASTPAIHEALRTVVA